MGGFVEILGGIIDAVKQKDAEAFLIPAMGSHGGGVETGQVEILHRLGVNEDELGAEITRDDENACPGHSLHRCNRSS